MTLKKFVIIDLGFDSVLKNTSLLFISIMQIQCGQKLRKIVSMRSWIRVFECRITTFKNPYKENRNGGWKAIRLKGVFNKWKKWEKTTTRVVMLKRTIKTKKGTRILRIGGGVWNVNEFDLVGNTRGDFFENLIHKIIITSRAWRSLSLATRATGNEI